MAHDLTRGHRGQGPTPAPLTVKQFPSLDAMLFVTAPRGWGILDSPDSDEKRRKEGRGEGGRQAGRKEGRNYKRVEHKYTLDFRNDSTHGSKWHQDSSSAF